MYESPIYLYTKELQSKLDDNILTAIHSYGISVDKEELVKALQYDRGQYEKGYADGLLHRANEWISVDERLPESNTRVLGYCRHLDEISCYDITEERWWTDEGWNTAKGFGITHWMPLPEPPKGD